MLELNLKQLNEPNMVGALMNLSHKEDLDKATAYRVGRILGEAKRVLKVSEKVNFDVAMKHAEKNAEGKEVLVDRQDGTKWPKIADANKDAFLADMEKYFVETKVQILVAKLDFELIKDLTPEQYVAISEICFNVPKE